MAWKSLGGTSRRYVNTETGETISRTQYDKMFGRLAGIPFSKDEIARLRKPGSLLSGIGLSKKKDSVYFHFPQGISEKRKRELIEEVSKRGKENVRFMYAKEGKKKHTSSEWHAINTPSDVGSAQGAANSDAESSDPDDTDTYEADDMDFMVFA